MPSLSVIVVRDYELVDVLNTLKWIIQYPLLDDLKSAAGESIHFFIHLFIEDTTKKRADRSAPFHMIQLGISCIYKVFGLAEVSSKKTFECFSVSRLVACHLMNCALAALAGRFAS